MEGKWNLILSVSEKGKKKDHRIVLDRVFHPEPRRYPMAELQVHISGDEKVSLPDTQLNDTVFMQENMSNYSRRMKILCENWEWTKRFIGSMKWWLRPRN